MWQKPEDTFMTPTYLIGGSDSSHTRQGGITLANLLVTMVLKLLGRIHKEMNGENALTIPFLSGISIQKNVILSPSFTVFSIPKALPRP